MTKEKRYIDLLLEKEVDGIIFVFARGYHDAMNMMSKRKVPWVLVDRYAPELHVDTVMVDNVTGGYQATEYLASLGHRRIGCITGPHDLSAGFDRRRGYERALIERGLPRSESFIVRGDFHVRSGYEGLRTLMGREDPPTAVFACNDLMALGAMRAAHELGIQVPDRLSIIGFDDVYFTSYLVPAMTTVQQPKRDLAALSVELLLFRIANPEATIRTELLSPTLVTRDSTAPVGVVDV